MEQTRNFIKKSLSNKKYEGTKEIDFIPGQYVRKAAELLGLENVNSFVLTSRSIRHIWNSHSNDHNKNHLPMTENDMLRIADVLASPDGVDLPKYDIKYGQGVRFYRKFTDGTVLCVFVVASAENDYSLQTGYKNSLQGMKTISIANAYKLKENNSLNCLTNKINSTMTAIAKTTKKTAAKKTAAKTTTKKATEKKTAKAKSTAKKTVNKELTKAAAKLKKTAGKAISTARKKVKKAATKAIAATKKVLKKKGLAGMDAPSKKGDIKSLVSKARNMALEYGINRLGGHKYTLMDVDKIMTDINKTLLEAEKLCK